MSTGEYIQSAIEALLNKNSSTTEPPVVTQYMWWVDTSSSPSILKIRDGANSSWITIGNVETNLGFLASGPGIITESLIANGAVTEAKIADDSISSNKVQDSSITSTKIADNAITSNKVQDASIIEAKIADNAITSTKIQDSAIVESKIADDSVSTDKLKNNAVTLGKIALGAKGDIISYDVSGSATALPVGTSGQVLTASSGAVTGLQWQNPTDMSSVDDVATSNSFRNSDLIQGFHPGAAIIESGWVDSFGNSNEQGADESASSNESYDNTNKLYEGVPGATNQNSDKDYTTESNYLQQEWTNANQSLNQATFTNGSATVTINTSGNWPSNCNNMRIANDANGTYYTIVSGQGTNSITLSSNYATATDATANWTIRGSKFTAGTVLLNGDAIGYGSDVTSGETFTTDATIVSGSLSNAFDNNTGTSVAFQNSEAFPLFIKVEFASPKTISKVSIDMLGAQSRSDDVDFTIDGSNNNSDWTTLLTVVNFSFTNDGGNADDFTFTNSTAYTYYRYRVTDAQTPGFCDLIEMEMMESAGGIPINTEISICDTEAQKTSTSNWSDINSGAVTETLNSQNAYYWLSYDPASSYGDGTEVKIFNQTGSVWRKIARNNGGTWQYNNDATSTATETWVNSTTNDMLHAVSQAMSSQSNNRMTGTELAAITDGEWEAANGFSTSTNSLTRGVTLHSTSSSQNPSVDQYRINYDSDNAAMDLRSKTFDPGASPAKAFLWAKVEHIDANSAGTFSVSRDGGSNWEAVSMVQQGEAISGDIRILRSVHTFTTGASGEDLRARYVTVSGESQKLHAWGLQARD
jgi:hypothetical protein